jgi:polyphosphate kinase
MGSADWMPRNLDRRVEIIFPVEEESAKAKAKHILDIQLKDNKKAYYLNKSGEYARIDKRGKEILSAQDTFVNEALKQDVNVFDKYMGRAFIPRLAIEES